MPSDNPQHAMLSAVELSTVQEIQETIKKALEHKKQQLLEEIKRYPPPIPACDQHFNYLLEQRTGISQELRQLNRLFEENQERQDMTTVMQAFIAESVYLDNETKQILSTAHDN